MAASLRRGTRLGKYRLDRRIGRGAFADVWKVRDTVEGRDFALKITRPNALEEFGRGDLEREARIASRLVHPNILALRNADWIGNRLVFATELARRNLAQYVGAKRSGAIALRVIRDVARGLAHAHAQKVMHRDVKPENVLVFPDGHAAIGDFGVWRFMRGEPSTMTEAGTLGYMAPEQAYGRPRLASDVFSLGLIGYELLTGVLLKWPFTWPPEEYRRFASKVPLPVQSVLRRAAEFEPSRRYRDAVELDRALESAFARVERERAPRRRRRRRVRAPEPISPLALQAEAFRKRHGKRLEMRFSCHRCDGPISESMTHCPWCGSADNSFREITPYPLVCPECERGVRAEWTACPWCYAGRLQGNGRRPRHDPRATRKCSRTGCEGQLRPYMRYCPLCKQRVRRPWRDPELPDVCPRCRWSVSRQFWRHCAWCGRRENRVK